MAQAPSAPSLPELDLAPSERVEIDLGDPGTIVDRLAEVARDLLESFIGQVPVILLALLVFVLALAAVRLTLRGLRQGLGRTSTEASVQSLVVQAVRVLLVGSAALVAFAVAGVPVGSVLAGLGIAGLALAFAVQSILENLISGFLILVRRPFRPGDQIRSGEYEGTVEEVDLRVTRLVDYDGETILLPNADVFRDPIINLTERGRRRTRVTIGIDYRDDHDAAREVIRDAVQECAGVLDTPPPQVLLTELGESGVEFEVMYWTAPDIASVVSTQDRVLSAAKSAVEANGMTIPWPIRTLVVDDRDDR